MNAIAAVDYFRQKALSLAIMGYFPVPIMPGTKKPMLADWPAYKLAAGDPERYANASVAVLCGHGLVAVDVDIYDAEIAAYMELRMELLLGSAPHRLGQIPKFALFYRIAGTFTKMRSRGFIHPLDTTRRVSRIEFLGDGQYVLTHGVHPVTHQEYAWPTVDLSLIPLAKLIEVTPDALQRVITCFEKMCLAEGMTPVETSHSLAEQHRKPSKLGQQAKDVGKVLAALATVPNDLDYHGWIAVGLAIKGAFGDTAEGVEAWLDFCEQYEGNTVEQALEKWDSFRPKDIGAGTIMRLADLELKKRHAKLFKPIAPPAAGQEQALDARDVPTLPDPAPSVVAPPAGPAEGTHEAAGLQQVGAPTYFALASRFGAMKRPGWLVEGMLRHASVYTVTAHPAAGKTTVITLLAAAIMQGKPFAGMRVDQGQVLYCAGDDPYGTIDRLSALARNGYPKANDIWLSASAFDATSLEAQEQMLSVAMMLNSVRLLVLDTLLHYTPASFDSENDNLAMSRYLVACRELTKLPGAPAILVLCHPHKRAPNEALELIPRGGSAALAASDGNLAVWLEEDIAHVHHSAKMRGAFDELQFRIERNVMSGILDCDGNPIRTVMAQHVTAEQAAGLANADAAGEIQVLGFLQTRGKDEWVGAGAIELAMNMPGRTVQRYLKVLMDRRLVRKQGSARATMYQAGRPR